MLDLLIRLIISAILFIIIFPVIWTFRNRNYKGNFILDLLVPYGSTISFTIVSFIFLDLLHVNFGLKYILICSIPFLIIIPSFRFYSLYKNGNSFLFFSFDLSLYLLIAGGQYFLYYALSDFNLGIL